jgi:hypothetical protein
MRALCGLCIALALAGCEYWQQFLPFIIDDETEPSPVLSDETAVGQHGQRFIALPGGRLLHGDPVLRIVDVRDPRRPHVEGWLDTPVAGGLFRIGNHVIFATGPGRTRYFGEREDVERLTPRNALLNVDVSDRAHPTVINEIPMLGSARVQTGSAIFTVESSSESEVLTPALCRYELQGDQLVRTGRLDLAGWVNMIEARGTRLMMVLGGEPSRVLVIDGAAAELRVVYETTVPTEMDPYRDALTIDGDKLRVLYQGADRPAIDTFDLTKDDANGRSGRCEPEPSEYYTYFSNALFSTRDHALFATTGGELCQFTFDATGNCPNKRCFGNQSGAYALHIPAAQRLLAISYYISLYDTASSALPPVLARADTRDRYDDYQEQVPQPIQVLNLDEPATAADGTPEPWLVGLLYYSSDLPAYFQLLSASDRTLTPRSAISEEAFPENLALYGRTLVTLSSMRLRTFDVRDLQAPRELGALDLNALYEEPVRFGDYIARLRIGESIGGPEPTEREREVQVVRLAATDEPPVASWPAEHRDWLKAENLLLGIERYAVSAEREMIGLSIQAYDLSDPAEPRWTGNHHVDFYAQDFFGTDSRLGALDYRAVGSSLVVAARSQILGQRSRRCSKSIDHAKCPQGDSSGCTPDYWSGHFICTTIDDGPESCYTQWLHHCVGTRCEPQTTYPSEAMLVVDWCDETVETELGPSSMLAVVDFRDPDRPTVLPPFELPGVASAWLRHEEIIDGTKYYRTTEKDGSFTATRIDFSDPRNPIISGPHTIPGSIVSVTETDVYTAGYSESGGVTVSRVPWIDSASPPAATRSWPDRSRASIQTDGSQYVYVTVSPTRREPSESDPHGHWTRLEVLDAQTLATVGMLDIDVNGRIVNLSDGRLLIDIGNRLLFVDARDPTHPTAQAAIRYTPSASVFPGDGQVYVVQDNRTVSYPSGFHNLVP